MALSALNPEDREDENRRLTLDPYRFEYNHISPSRLPGHSDVNPSMYRLELESIVYLRKERRTRGVGGMKESILRLSVERIPRSQISQCSLYRKTSRLTCMTDHNV